MWYPDRCFSHERVGVLHIIFSLFERLSPSLLEGPLPAEPVTALDSPLTPRDKAAPAVHAARTHPRPRLASIVVVVLNPALRSSVLLKIRISFHTNEHCLLASPLHR